MLKVVNFHDCLERVLQRHLSDVRRLIKVERLSGGASQETYKLLVETNKGEKPLALRRATGGQFQQPDAELPGLSVEALLIKSARAVGVPGPEIYHVLTRDDDLGDGFIMQWLEGETLGTRIVRAPEYKDTRSRLAYECGKLIAQIHGIDLEATGLRDKLGTMSPGQFVERIYAQYQKLITPQPMIDYTAQWLRQNLPQHFELTLVHNDFRNGNFILKSEGIVAVLDWESAHIGDPMRDLGWICTNSWRFGEDKPVGGFGYYDDLYRGYEEISGKKVDPEQVKFWEVFGSFWWSVGCLTMADQYRSGFDKTVERPAIGRRSSECQIDCVNLLIPGAVEKFQESTQCSGTEIPRADELLVSVRDFIRNDVTTNTKDRTKFLSKVAANSLDIVLRELEIGPTHQAQELDRLKKLYDEPNQELTTLRWRLVNDIRAGNRPLTDPELQNHLRQTVVNQIRIDQPGYSGLKKALEN